MVERFHGVDRHKKHFTASVVDREGKETGFVAKSTDLKGYIEKLGVEDAVIVEASAGAFYWADLVESQGATVYVLDPFKFKIIRDSWNKTDKQDARNMAKALWIYMVTGKFGIPSVYKPSMEIRELRTLFCQYRLFTRQMTMLKNNIQAIFTDSGVDLKSKEKAVVLSRKHGEEALAGYEVSPARRISLRLNRDLLWKSKSRRKRSKERSCLPENRFHTR